MAKRKTRTGSKRKPAARPVRKRPARKPAKKRSGSLARPLAAFEAYLAGRGGRLTRPRRAALRVLLGLKRQFTCVDIERAIRRSRSHTRAHRATVYRLLPHLVAAGLVREVSLGRRGLVHYERTRATSDGELLCTRCGRAEPVRTGRLAAAAARLARRRRYRPESPVVTIRGVCAACRGTTKKRRRKVSRREK